MGAGREEREPAARRGRARRERASRERRPALFTGREIQRCQSHRAAQSQRVAQRRQSAPLYMRQYREAVAAEQIANQRQKNLATIQDLVAANILLNDLEQKQAASDAGRVRPCRAQGLDHPGQLRGAAGQFRLHQADPRRHEAGRDARWSTEVGGWAAVGGQA